VTMKYCSPRNSPIVGGCLFGRLVHFFDSESPLPFNDRIIDSTTSHQARDIRQKILKPVSDGETSVYELKHLMTAHAQGATSRVVAPRHASKSDADEDQPNIDLSPQHDPDGAKVQRPIELLRARCGLVSRSPTRRIVAAAAPVARYSGRHLCRIAFSSGSSRHASQSGRSARSESVNWRFSPITVHFGRRCIKIQAWTVNRAGFEIACHKATARCPRFDGLAHGPVGLRLGPIKPLAIFVVSLRVQSNSFRSSRTSRARS
jgi:hypothetical protein